MTPRERTAYCRHVVGPGQLGHRHQRLDAAGDRVAGVGADIAADVAFERQQAAVGGEARRAPGGAGRGCAPRRSGSRADPRSRRPSCGTGARSRPARRYSGNSDIFWPKRRRHRARRREGRSRHAEQSAMPVRSMCGICAEAVSVTRPVRALEGGMPARASSGMALWRCERISISTIRGGSGERRIEALGLEPAVDQDVAWRLGVHLRRVRARAPRRDRRRHPPARSRRTPARRCPRPARGVAAITAATGWPT